MTVIDVHTHMLSEPWLKLLKETGNPIEAGNRLALSQQHA